MRYHKSIYIYIYIPTIPDQTRPKGVLSWCWYDFDTVLMRSLGDVVFLIWFWYVFETFLENNATQKKNRNHILDPNHKWNHINIITAKPGHKQIITANHIWIISKSLEKKETLHLRVCWCVTHTMTYQYSTVRYMHTYKTGVR